MKTILVPTDYSDPASNALQYALELARTSNANLILLHAYHLPVLATEYPVLPVSLEELARENNRRIKKLKEKVAGEAKGNIKLESMVRPGFASDVIADVAKEINADLIVMGITGASKTTQVLIGSNTTAVMSKTSTPVLVIPSEARYRAIEKIALACNYNEPVNLPAIMKVEALARFFNAKLLVVDMEKPSVVPAYENAIAGETLGVAFKNIDHVMFYSASEDIAEGLNTFVDDHNCNWLAMIPHKRNILGSLFHKSNTKKLAFHTHVPLLSIHEQ